MNGDFTEYRRLSAKEFLDRLEEEHRFAVSPPIDVEKIVELIGATLDFSHYPDNPSIIGSVSFENGQAIIRVNPFENNYEPRKRFTIAHEIGHLIQHIGPQSGFNGFFDTQKTMNRDASYWDQEEYEANNFAAQLLMPTSLLGKHGNEIIGRYIQNSGEEKMPATLFMKEMASLFNVSEQAMRYRLKSIGAIN